MVLTYDNCGYPFEPVELYDLFGDPYQTASICGDQPEVVAQCRGYLCEWIQEQRMRGDCIPDPLEEILHGRGHKLNSNLQWEHRRSYYGLASP
jgi:hypothetical protein